MSLGKSKAFAIAIAVLTIIAGAFLAGAIRTPFWKAMTSSTPVDGKEGKSKTGYGLYATGTVQYQTGKPNEWTAQFKSLNSTPEWKAVKSGKKDLLKATRWLAGFGNAFLFATFILAVVLISAPGEHGVKVALAILSTLGLVLTAPTLGTYAGYATTLPKKMNGKSLKFGSSYGLVIVAVVLAIPAMILAIYCAHKPKTHALPSTHTLSSTHPDALDGSGDLGHLGDDLTPPTTDDVHSSWW